MRCKQFFTKSLLRHEFTGKTNKYFRNFKENSKKFTKTKTYKFLLSIFYLVSIFPLWSWYIFL